MSEVQHTPGPIARDSVRALRQRETQALGAALSRQNWQEMEAAYNQLRDKLDALLINNSAWVTIPARDGIEARYGLNDTYPGDPVNVAVAADPTIRELVATIGEMLDGNFCSLGEWTGEAERLLRRVRARRPSP